MIADDTPLIPELVAERVVREECPGDSNPRPMIRYLCRRAERQYAVLLDRKDALGWLEADWLEAFMIHWIRGVMNSRVRASIRSGRI